VLLIGACLGLTAPLDMDYHWHVALGRDLVAHGFPSTEPFSHLPVGTPDRQSWLADAAFAVLDRIGGLAAIRALCAIVYAAGCLSVLRLARRRTPDLGLALLAVGIYVALGLARLRVRPDIFTLALTPLFLELLERPPSWRQPLAVLAVSALWANLHAGALIGALLAIAHLWPPSRIRVANAVAAAAGLALTPDGLGGLLRFTADTTTLRPLIPEWQRLWERPFAEFAPEWVVVAGVVALCGIATVFRTRGQLPTAILGFVLAASAVRFLFALILPVLWALSARWRMRPAAQALVIVAGLALLVFFPLEHLRQTSAGLKAAGLSYLGPDPPKFPLEAARWLARSGLTGNLAHPAGWGGYLAYHLAPRFKTATDGRITHFGADLGLEWSKGIDGPNRESIFARRGIDLVVIPASMLAEFHKDQPYEPIYGDSFAMVLIRSEGPNYAENAQILKAAAKRR
jgi:hypothetical protein